MIFWRLANNSQSVAFFCRPQQQRTANPPTAFYVSLGLEANREVETVDCNSLHFSVGEIVDPHLRSRIFRGKKIADLYYYL